MARFQQLMNDPVLRQQAYESGFERVRFGERLSFVHEVDEVAWLDADVAAARLSYAHDRAQVEALVATDRQGSLSTWPLALLRHAKARSRSSWTAEDWLRPLDAQGRIQPTSSRCSPPTASPAW